MSSSGYKRGSYLENYLESVATLPAELRRNFALMRELDGRTEEYLDQIDEDQKQYLHALKRAVRDSTDEPSEDVPNKIRNDFQQCLEYADEKVAIAVQTYELVDKHIRRLDNDLKKFEAEIEQATAAGTLAGGPPSPVTAYEKPEKQDKKRKNGPEKKKKKEEKKHKFVLGDTPTPAREPRILNVDLDMPIDPNEPTYCICNRVSFGEMVGCDSPECRVEWFHFECVGLTGPPKGKWYCPECAALYKNKTIRR